MVEAEVTLKIFLDSKMRFIKICRSLFWSDSDFDTHSHVERGCKGRDKKMNLTMQAYHTAGLH